MHIPESAKTHSKIVTTISVRVSSDILYYKLLIFLRSDYIQRIS